jgi:hypothetical protein
MVTQFEKNASKASHQDIKKKITEKRQHHMIVMMQISNSYIFPSILLEISLQQ